MIRKTSIVVAQKPGRWLLRVTVKNVDGEIYSKHAWTWLGKVLRFLTGGKWPVAKVKVYRSKDFVLRSKS